MVLVSVAKVDAQMVAITPVGKNAIAMRDLIRDAITITEAVVEEMTPEGVAVEDRAIITGSNNSSSMDSKARQIEVDMLNVTIRLMMTSNLTVDL